MTEKPTELAKKAISYKRLELTDAISVLPFCESIDRVLLDAVLLTRICQYPLPIRPYFDKTDQCWAKQWPDPKEKNKINVAHLTLRLV